MPKTSLTDKLLHHHNLLRTQSMPNVKQLFLQTMPLLLHRFSEIFQYFLQNRLHWVLKELPNWHQMLRGCILIRYRPCVGRITRFYCSLFLFLYKFKELRFATSLILMLRPGLPTTATTQAVYDKWNKSFCVYFNLLLPYV